MFTEIITHVVAKSKKKSKDNILKYFFFRFVPEKKFVISCKRFAVKRQTLFLENKNVIKLLSVEFVLSMANVKLETIS